jgi:hypothetical protein
MKVRKQDGVKFRHRKNHTCGRRLAAGFSLGVRTGDFDLTDACRLTPAYLRCHPWPHHDARLYSPSATRLCRVFY